MEAIVECCCGLDVHQAVVVACLLKGKAGPKARREARSFGTHSADLAALRDWLAAEGCTQVAMESTGVYWKPVHAMLEDHFDVLVGNARHIKAVPGRKTDVNDAEWIADLLRHGLIRRSFVPAKPFRELRDLFRYRRKLVESRTAERNRLLKVLETANIKLASVASNVFGVSGMAMLHAILEGTGTPEEMARLARGALRKKIPQIALALDGRLEDHHRFLLRLQLDRLRRVDEDLAALQLRIDARLAPYSPECELLRSIPGVDAVLAGTIVAEVGTDVSSFPSPRHLAAWAGLCPSNNESAGTRRAAGLRKGNTSLKSALVQGALAGAR